MTDHHKPDYQKIEYLERELGFREALPTDGWKDAALRFLASTTCGPDQCYRAITLYLAGQPLEERAAAIVQYAIQNIGPPA